MAGRREERRFEVDDDEGQDVSRWGQGVEGVVDVGGGCWSLLGTTWCSLPSKSLLRTQGTWISTHLPLLHSLVDIRQSLVSVYQTTVSASLCLLLY